MLARAGRSAKGDAAPGLNIETKVGPIPLPERVRVPSLEEDAADTSDASHG